MGIHSTDLLTPGPRPTQEFVFDIKSTPLRALAPSGPPLTGGYIFAREANLWLLSTDTTRQQRLTYFTPPDEYAYGPAWSPDGKQIAFTFSPKTDPSLIPSTDIWVINPDGSGARELVKHGDNELLRDPAWSSDGRYLYFTVEQSDPNAPGNNSSGPPQSGVRIDHLDTKSGARSRWMDSAEMPAGAASPDRMLFLEDVLDKSTDPSQPGLSSQQLGSVNVDGSGKTVIVDKKTYVAMNFPAMSPGMANGWLSRRSTCPA